MSATLTQDAIKIAETIFELLEQEQKAHRFFAKNYPRMASEHDRVVQRALRDAPAQELIYRQWRTDGRQLLAIHPELMDELRHASTVSVVTEVLATLPYMNPMIIFPEPVAMSAWKDDEALVLHGMLLYGRVEADNKSLIAGAGTVEGAITGTHDPDNNGIGALMFIEVRDNNGRHLDWELSKITLPLSAPKLDIEVLAAIRAESFGWDSDTVDRTSGRNHLAECMQILVGVLLYLCSTTLEVEVVPKSRLKHMVIPERRKPPLLVKVGWQTGPALTKARQQWAEGDRASLGRGQAPQHRRCHFKTIWTGKGRTIPKTAFIAPYITHRELWDRTDTKTVRAVPRPKKEKVS